MPPYAVPLIGHSLEYGKDPPAFLQKVSKQVGSSIFWVNLAGQHMLMVTGVEELRLLTKIPESKLSARQAVLGFGFEHLLGLRNILGGVDVHKAIIKGIWRSPKTTPDQEIQDLLQVIRRALKTEVQKTVEQQRRNMSKHKNDEEGIDFFLLMRRVFLRAAIERMISPDLLTDWEFAFMDEFMTFQDAIENAVTKTVVLPHWLALPLFLKPVQRLRERLERVLRQRLEQIIVVEPSSSTSTNRLGFWLDEVYNNQKMPIEDIAHYIISLLFSAHRNPAIGSAQAFLMLHDQADPKIIAKCREEAVTFLRTPTWHVFDKQSPTLTMVNLETLRLIAHAIGGLRTAQEDLPLNLNNKKYTVPKGSLVSFSHIVISQSPQYWRQPTKFDPTRPLIDFDDDYRFTTFSQGIHKCPGRKYALVMMHSMLALLLEECKVTLPSKLTPVDFQEATLAQRAASILVTIKPLNNKAGAPNYNQEDTKGER